MPPSVRYTRRGGVAFGRANGQDFFDQGCQQSGQGFLSRFGHDRRIQRLPKRFLSDRNGRWRCSFLVSALLGALLNEWPVASPGEFTGAMSTLGMTRFFEGQPIGPFGIERSSRKTSMPPRHMHDGDFASGPPPPRRGVAHECASSLAFARDRRQLLDAFRQAGVARWLIRCPNKKYRTRKEVVFALVRSPRSGSRVYSRGPKCSRWFWACLVAAER